MKYAKVYFEDVEVGHELPALVKGPIQQIQLTRYAGASGDFNPIHQDDAFAKAAGMGGVFAHGMLSMGFVAQSVTDWVGVGTVKKIAVRFAGLVRLGVVPEHVAPMSLAEMVPAPGQGCLAVQSRASDGATIDSLSVLDHPASRTALEAERGLMARLGGGCALPLGAFAEPIARGVRMVAIALTPDGSRFARTEVDAATSDGVAALAALDLSAGGADEILGLVRP